MAKITISRLLETSRILTSKAGQELQDFITYVAELAEQTLRNLRNGLTFQDNFSCKVSTVSITHNVAQEINTDGKTPTGIIPIRVVSATTGLDSFSWYLNAKGKLEVKATFTGAPTNAIDTTLVILF